MTTRSSTLSSPLTPRTAHLRGTAASPGAHTGAARIIATIRDARALRPGNVAVCATITPALAAAIPHPAAIVADAGGALSSAATVARERRIPAVVATTDATRRIRPGQHVEVDGTRGVVRILS